jgi:hypothetical protein
MVCLCMLALLASGLRAQSQQPPQRPVDISGTWVGSTEVPDQGTDQVTMVLKKAEDGYTGTIADSLGVIAPGTELRNVTVANGTLSYSFSLADGAVVTIKLKADDEKMTGEWTHQEGQTGTIVFERKKV